MCLIHDGPGWQPGVLRLVDVFVEGLRHRGADHPPPRRRPAKRR
jgi:hypothetical protein